MRPPASSTGKIKVHEILGTIRRRALRTVFSALCHLETLRLNFHASYKEAPSDSVSSHPQVTYFLKLQDEIFATLAAHRTRVVGPEQPSRDTQRSLRKENFRHIFQSWGKWTSLSLRSLTIRNDQLLCINTFKDISLPQLVLLSLHQFILEPLTQSNVVAFILHRKASATLTRLELQGCSIRGGEMFPHPWNAVLEQLMVELGALCEFVLVGEVEEDPSTRMCSSATGRCLITHIWIPEEV
ncbi:hypothetical protein C8R45DRAFT_1207643 [Mycena sanguinolenta]|nr:hypothetical protein C8R45DRAFT_1207643 [Mycena sanguinolenta]